MDAYITGATIRNLREKKGLTQAELGERMSVSEILFRIMQNNTELNKTRTNLNK